MEPEVPPQPNTQETRDDFSLGDIDGIPVFLAAIFVLMGVLKIFPTRG